MYIYRIVSREATPSNIPPAETEFSRAPQNGNLKKALVVGSAVGLGAAGLMYARSRQNQALELGAPQLLGGLGPEAQIDSPKAGSSRTFKFEGMAEKIKPSQDYSMTPRGVKRLNKYVADIKNSRIGMNFIDPEQLEVASQSLDVKKLVTTLPEGMTLNDFEGMVELSAYTECATPIYSGEFREGSDASGSSWLRDFNDDIWDPDETGHALPFEIILLQLGHSQASIDARKREVLSRIHQHGKGYTNAHLTGFGMIQEYLTVHWYKQIYDILRPSNPEVADGVDLVKQREGLHTTWYRDMTAIQIEENPRLIRHVAEEAVRFQMPGTELVPDLQAKVDDWMKLMGADLSKIYKDLVRLHKHVSGTVANGGRLMVDIGALTGMPIKGPVDARHLKMVLDHAPVVGDYGYALIGAGIMQKFGLGEEPEYYGGLLGPAKKAVVNLIASNVSI